MFKLSIIGRLEHSTLDSYATLLKTSLTFAWSYDEAPNEALAFRPRDEFFDSFYRIPNEQRDLTALYRDLERSNHPPLYYAIVHIMQTFDADGRAHLYHGLMLNLLFSMLSVAVFCTSAEEAGVWQSDYSDRYGPHGFEFWYDGNRTKA